MKAKKRVLVLTLFLTFFFSTVAQASRLGMNEWSKGGWGQPSPIGYQGKRIALVAHGLFDDLESFTGLAGFLSEFYDHVLGFEYTSGKPTIEEIASVLDSQLKNNDLAKNNRIDFFAHSLGGLVSRYTLEKLGWGDQITHLITLATPHIGVPLTGKLEFFRESILPLIENNPERIPLMIQMFPQLAGLAEVARNCPLSSAFFDEMIAGSEFFKKLNDESSLYSEKAKYQSIQGKRPNTRYPDRISAIRGTVLIHHRMNGITDHDGALPHSVKVKKGNKIETIYYSTDECLTKKSGYFKKPIVLHDLGHFELCWNDSLGSVLRNIFEKWDQVQEAERAPIEDINAPD